VQPDHGRTRLLIEVAPHGVAHGSVEAGFIIG
jgi:hypothetical protein